MTSPIDASIAASTVPILTMLIAAVYLKEPITWKKAIGVAVGASGALLLILSNGTVDTAGRSGSIAGDMICLMGALSVFAIYLAVFKRLIARYSSVTLMKWMFLYAAICAIPLCGGDAAAIDYAHLSPALWGGVLYVVCCATFFSYLLIPVGQKYLRPTVVGVLYTYLQPFIASVVAVLAGLDRFGFAKGIAAVMVCLGVYIVNQSKSRAQLDAERAARQQAGFGSPNLSPGIIIEKCVTGRIMICIESGKQQRTVSVAQEPEVVIQREIVNFAPIFADKCRDQQQQCALRLVKVRNDAADDPVAVTPA